MTTLLYQQKLKIKISRGIYKLHFIDQKLVLKVSEEFPYANPNKSGLSS